MVKPTHTVVTDLNRDEMFKFKERRRFFNYKDKAHFYFDKIWINKHLTRDEAYQWLAKRLKVTEPEAHFSNLNNELCKEAIFFCQQILNDLRRLDLDCGLEPSTPFYILYS